jgi:serine/threonine protein kinase
MATGFKLSHARWLAPEYITTAGASLPSPTEEADVWSFGLLCLEVFTGEDPFYSLSDSETHTLLSNGIIPHEHLCPKVIGAKMWGLMQYCWRINPLERPSMSVVQSAVHAITLYPIGEWFLVPNHRGACLLIPHPHAMTTRVVCARPTS